MSPVRTWDNTQAQAEGWMINSNIRIIYYGLSSVFDTAQEALDHVIAKATAGSAYHIRALVVIAAQDLSAGLSWIRVSGSYGSFKAYLDTGEVFDVDLDDVGEDYSSIVKVDVAEVKLNFPNNKHGDEWDVTHIGCWYADGSYEGPASGRQAWLDNIDHEDDLVRATRASIVPKPYVVTVLATLPVWQTVEVTAPNIEEAKQNVELDDSWFIQGQFQPIDVDLDLLGNVEKTVEPGGLVKVPEPTADPQVHVRSRTYGVPVGLYESDDTLRHTTRLLNLIPGIYDADWLFPSEDDSDRNVEVRFVIDDAEETPALVGDAIGLIKELILS